MVAGPDPTIQRRRLRVELRKARLDANLTQRDVAQAMDWSPSKLIRIENGAVNITPIDLRALLGHYGVTDKRRIDTLLEMARAGKTRSWSDFKGVHSGAFLTYLGFESSASIIRQYEPLLIPGLLQTEEYARAILSNVYGKAQDDADRRWEARERRQELHERDDRPQMFFILDEAVIQRRVGGAAVMRRQLERLRALADEPHVSVQVIPFRAGAHPGMRGPFTLLEFADANDDNVLYLEHTTGDTTTRDDPEETGPYLDFFWSLEDLALSTEESNALVDKIIADMSEPAQPTVPVAG